MFSSFWAFTQLFFRWLFRKKGGQMAYSISWNESSPAGASTQAATIDTELQELKQSIRERMNDILDSTTAWETDGDNPKLLDVTALAGSPVTARVWDGAAFSIASGAAVVIDFVQETLDSGSLHDNSSNPSRITVPSTGYYVFGATLNVLSGAASALGTISLRQAGTTTIAHEVVEHPGGSTNHSFSVSTIIFLSSSSYIEVLLQQSSGNTWATSNTQVGSFFHVHRLAGSF